MATTRGKRIISGGRIMRGRGICITPWGGAAKVLPQSSARDITRRIWYFGGRAGCLRRGRGRARAIFRRRRRQAAENPAAQFGAGASMRPGFFPFPSSQSAEFVEKRGSGQPTRHPPSPPFAGGKRGIRAGAERRRGAAGRIQADGKRRAGVHSRRENGGCKTGDKKNAAEKEKRR